MGVQAYADIEQQYRKAQRQIEGQINAWYGRFANNNNVTIEEARRMLTAKELDELKWDVQEYIKYAEENAISGQWVKELENASARYHISRLEALKLQTQQSLEVMFGNQLDTFDDTLSQVYKSGFYRTAFEIQKGFGVGWDFGTLDDVQIAKVINKPWAVDGRNFSQRIWGNKTKLINELNQTLTQNIVLGKDPQKAIDQIAKKMNTSKHNAGRLVMTEEAFFSSEAQKDCFKELDVEEYEIVATLDSHTSDICQEMDGKHFPMSKWEVGATAPPFHVYCRTTTVPYFADDFGSVGERAARMADGEPTYHVPADMTYKQWQKSFLGGGDKSGLNKVQPVVSDDVLSEKEIDKKIKALRKEQKELSDFGTYDEVVNTWGSVDEWFGDEPEKKRFIETQKEIEKLLAMKPGVSVIGGKSRGASMNITEALQGTNPNYSQGGQYRVNCQRCVQTYEYRRRGFDVEALPKPKKGGKIKWGNECFIDKQGNVPQFTYNQTEQQIKDELTKAPDNARYIIHIKWSTSRKAHVFIAEKENGIIRYVDPQSAKDDVSDYFSRGVDGKYGFLRIDDKDITKDMSLIKATMK
jgi:SPP1 gp7 family putative phage head morphogenesis protein